MLPSRLLASHFRKRHRFTSKIHFQQLSRQSLRSEIILRGDRLMSSRSSWRTRRRRPVQLPRRKLFQQPQVPGHVWRSMKARDKRRGNLQQGRKTWPFSHHNLPNTKQEILMNPPGLPMATRVWALMATPPLSMMSPRSHCHSVGAHPLSARRFQALQATTAPHQLSRNLLLRVRHLHPRSKRWSGKRLYSLTNALCTTN